MATIDTSDAASENGFSSFMDVLCGFDKPLVASVNGVGVGIGITLLLHCDYVHIAEGSRLRAPFITLGVVPEAASSFLFPLGIGWRNAVDLLYESDFVSAERAVQASASRTSARSRAATSNAPVRQNSDPPDMGIPRLGSSGGLMLAFRIVPAVLTIVLACSIPASAKEVTVCGTTVSDGVLVADLDCSDGGWAVTILDGGTLDLAGHTIVMGSVSGIGCERRCTIEGGGGSVVGSGFKAVASSHRGARVILSNLNIVSDERLSIRYGVLANSVELANSVISGTVYGVFAGRSVVASDSVITDNIFGLRSNRRLTILNSTLRGNSWGAAVSDQRIDAAGATITGNGILGTSGRRVRASASTINSNGGGEHCTDLPQDCADILSASRPDLESVSCSKSAGLEAAAGGTMVPSGESWGVCALD